MPAALAAADPELSLFTLGLLEAPARSDDAFDTTLIAPAPPREDPCARLRKTLPEPRG
jgi:hypothetical protein